MNYKDKLKDPRWQKKRLQIMDRDNWKCCMCNDEKSTLVVHHKYYTKGLNPWDYDDDALITVCENCHIDIHSKNVLLDEFRDFQDWYHAEFDPDYTSELTVALQFYKHWETPLSIYGFLEYTKYESRGYIYEMANNMIEHYFFCKDTLLK